MTLLTRVDELEAEVRETRELAQKAQRVSATHEEQINGRRGLQAAVDENTAAVKSLYRAAYWLAGIIIVASIGFAFSVMLLIGQ